ncbi:uncharacterized protein LOC114327745 [Diabrotica virgifera virgifera]|uniref:Apolipophorin-3-like n=1 Tax=Diabrotica virgifera virgifera TaxID=50390 RepID=A0ABM5IGH5_DIAVI|nr:uncharacterized protein LOC114327745 [Diabrotica virgifera virgifera]
MNKYFVFVAIAFLAIQAVESKPRASQQQRPAAQNVAEDDLAKKAQDLIKKADEVVTGNLPSTEQIINNVEETGKKLVSNIKDFNDYLKTQLTANKGDVDKILRQVSDNLHATSEKIQKDVLGPQGQKKASEIRENLHAQIKSAATQIEKLTAAVKPEAEKVKNDLLAAANLFLDKAINVADDLKKVVAEHKN